VLAVLMHRYGPAESLSVETVPDPTPAPGEVVVRLEAAALNHLDIDLRAGTSRIPLELPHILGGEGVGRIAYTPPGLNIGLAVGDRVMVLEEVPCGACHECQTGHQNRCESAAWIGVTRPGCYAQLIATPADGVIALPEARDAFEWAAVQAAFGTAWHMLITRGQLVAGERVLVNGAGAGIGSAAIQVALLAGSDVIATAGSQTKLERARELGATACINYLQADWHAQVLAATNGAGVDLVYDHVGGDILVQSLRTLRPGGRIATCGAHAGETVPLDVIQLFRHEHTIIGSRTCTPRELQTVIDLVATGKLKPVVDSVFPLTAITQAHQRMEQRNHFGKIILDPHANPDNPPQHT
jgi:NADPH:quinone reductase-like Zn-dependent oxidoreductase